MIRFSILVPNLGYSKHLEECVDSLNKLDQNVNYDYEILIYDQSDESDYQKLKNYLNKLANNKIQLIKGKIKSLPLARKELMRYSSGEYIVFIDSDDYVEKNLLSTIQKSLKEHEDPDILICSFNIVDENNNFLVANIASGDPNSVVDDFLYGAEYTSVWRKVFKKQLYVETNYSSADLNVTFGEDWLFSRCLFRDAKRVCVDKDINCYNYRINSNSITHSFSIDWAYDSILMRDPYLPAPGSDYQRSKLVRSKFRQLVFVSKIFATKKMMTSNEYIVFASKISMSLGFEKRVSWNYESKGEKVLYFLFSKKHFRLFWFLIKVVAKKSRLQAS